MRNINIHIIIDGLGWEVVKHCSAFNFLTQVQRPLDTVLGFSSSAIPTILTGKLPDEHGRGNLFYKSDASTFPLFSIMKKAPSFLTNFSLPSRALKKVLLLANKKYTGFKGYYQAYDFPVNRLSSIAICEDSNIFSPNGISGSKTIFDHYVDSNTRWKCFSYKEFCDSDILSNVSDDCILSDLEHCFVYLCEYDAFGHANAHHKNSMISKANDYGKSLKSIYTTLNNYFDEVNMTVCSDHGMVPLISTIDIMTALKQNSFLNDSEYEVILDSTMARFYCHTDNAKNQIVATLELFDGSFLSSKELTQYHFDFKGQYGSLIFIVNEGLQISPSHMGRVPCKGMHGYRPDIPNMKACFLSSYIPNKCPTHISDLLSVYREKISIKNAQLTN